MQFVPGQAIGHLVLAAEHQRVARARLAQKVFGEVESARRERISRPASCRRRSASARPSRRSPRNSPRSGPRTGPDARPTRHAVPCNSSSLRPCRRLTCRMKSMTWVAGHALRRSESIAAVSFIEIPPPGYGIQFIRPALNHKNSQRNRIRPRKGHRADCTRLRHGLRGPYSARWSQPLNRKKPLCQRSLASSAWV